MKAELILKEAGMLVGIPDLDDSLKVTGLAFINMVLTEIGLSRIESLEDALDDLAEERLQALLSGVAMFVSNALGLEDSRTCFYDDFRKRLAKLNCKTELVADRLPKGEWF